MPTPDPILPEHVSLADACRELGVPIGTVYQWAYKGTRKWAALRAWKTLNGTWRVPVAAIREIQARAPKAMGLARPGTNGRRTA